MSIVYHALGEEVIDFVCARVS